LLREHPNRRVLVHKDPTACRGHKLQRGHRTARTQKRRLEETRFVVFSGHNPQPESTSRDCHESPSGQVAWSIAHPLGPVGLDKHATASQNGTLEQSEKLVNRGVEALHQTPTDGPRITRPGT
jgi:hypothetical protein